MIADPLATRLSEVRTSATVTDTDVNVDMVGFGPGSKTTRRYHNLGAVYGVLSVDATISHDIAKNGRRRSVIRFDARIEADTTTPTLEATASAYLVVDQADKGPVEQLIATDLALSGLLHSLITSRAGGATLVPSTALLDFLKGEP